MQLQAMIDKTVNCTAIEREESAALGYGDYMYGAASIVFNECADLNGTKDFG